MIGYGNHLKDQFKEFQITRCQVPTLQVVTKYRGGTRLIFRCEDRFGGGIFLLAMACDFTSSGRSLAVSWLFATSR